MPLKSWKDMVADSETTEKPKYELLEDGTYDFVIEEAEHRTSSTGKDGYNISTVVESGPYKGRKVFDTFWISPESSVSMGIFFRQMNEIGLDQDFWRSEPDDAQICAALTGKRFKGTTKKDTHNNKTNNRFRGFSKAAPQSVVDTSAVAQATSAVASLTPTNTPSTPAVESAIASPSITASAPAESPWDTVNSSDSGVPTFGGAPSAPF